MKTENSHVAINTVPVQLDGETFCFAKDEREAEALLKIIKAIQDYRHDTLGGDDVDRFVINRIADLLTTPWWDWCASPYSTENHREKSVSLESITFADSDKKQWLPRWGVAEVKDLNITPPAPEYGGTTRATVTKTPGNVLAEKSNPAEGAK